MKDFPFEAVYDYFAKPFAEAGLVELPIGGCMPPTLWTAGITKDGKIDRVSLLPDVSQYFDSSNTKALLGMAIREALTTLVGEPICLVLISEVYLLEKKITELDEVRKVGSLKDDPQSTEAVMITVYRPEGERMGTCQINADRSVTYAPLHKTTDIRGSMSMNPDKDDLPERETA